MTTREIIQINYRQDLLEPRKAALPVLFYSRIEFSIFRPAAAAGATRWTDQGEIWQGGADLLARR